MGIRVVLWDKVGQCGAPDLRRRSAFMGDLEQMFLGHYDHTIDDKGRLTVPARFRDLLADGAVITLGFDGNLIVMTSAMFDDFSSRLDKMNMTNPDSRSLRRMILSFAERLELDRVGRILLPQFLRQQASLVTNAIIAGVGDYFEIWSPELWARQVSLLQDPEVNAQRFAALDLSA